MQDFIDRFDVEGSRGRPGIYLGDSAGLLRVMRLAAFLERELAASCSVKPGQFQVLAALRRRDPLSMTAGELARAAILTNRALEQRMAQHRALNAALTLDEREALSDILRKLLIAVEGEAA